MQNSSDPVGGLRETKKRATRHRLTTAGRRLTLAHGLDNVTVEMICAEVGVSVRTFFNYFTSKDEALAGDELPLGDDESRRRFQDGGPTGVLLADLMTVLFPADGLHGDDREELRTAFAVMMQEPRILARQLARGMEHEERLAGMIARRQGLEAPDTTSRTAAAVAQTLLRRAVAEWVQADDDSDIATHIRRELVAATAVITAGTGHAGP
ncbi:TetR/AcrR family transcriptional regulator [Nakamurella deserti]|uniref:TetR/AcrR family transcriptional regulator n=1 Tax=Nakamurella deserti TaxID=2164074 RepID=UPI001479661D|nr:TetR/AcrR family transcriptional regulator [Nakamurella deserti]